MLATFAMTLTLASAPPAGGCFVAQLSTAGRGAHGSAIMLESAPHRLIRALDRLALSPQVADLEIRALTAGPAINVIPARAEAIVEIRPSDVTAAPNAVLAALEPRLDAKIEVRALAAPCRQRRAATR